MEMEVDDLVKKCPYARQKKKTVRCAKTGEESMKVCQGGLSAADECFDAIAGKLTKKEAARLKREVKEYKKKIHAVFTEISESIREIHRLRTYLKNIKKEISTADKEKSQKKPVKKD